ncbi:LTA synthase family protein [Denitrificimonas caeni]|uniref:LTA synthase family protein n=1 Tax=Denitrificimonas caeni TaxID=521720 RepID=UPI0019646AAA|nr:LTA synthase family protein [Denitrificimonas caeni]
MLSSTPSVPKKRITLGSHLLFSCASIVLWLLLLTALRALLLAYNHEMIGSTSTADLLEAFSNGVRFDLRLIVYVSVPLLLGILIPWLMNQRRMLVAWLVLSAAVSILLGIIELDFYREFHQRLNSLVFQYLNEDPATVLSMLWHGFPVVSLLSAWLACTLVMFLLFSWAERKTRIYSTAASAYSYLAQGVTFSICLVICVIAARGTLRQGPPLRWGDAYTTHSMFANHLGLNPVLSLYNAAKTTFSEHRDNIWKATLPAAEAQDITRNLVLTTHDQLTDADSAAIRRIYTPVADTQLNVRNVVVILMESFAGRYTGALGSNDQITPEFDKLSKEGLLFTRFFANGTHTHQGMFASMACFPNLPAFEYLMQSPEGGHQFSGLPQLLSVRNFQDAYVYNGDFAWDNQQGFFSNQGMTNFIGRNDYVNPVVSDPTWGVSDQDMFDRSIIELNKLKDDKPFYALLQSLSNHTPYALPDTLPTDAVTGHGSLDLHLTAMRYSDWALGEFFKQAKQQPWYNDTLFVVLGDHGFGAPEQMTEMDLYRFHVPMLLLAPGIQDKWGAKNSTVGSQVDMVPTIMGRLGDKVQHQCWGRDLLTLPKDDQGFAIIKPSGSDQTVALIKGERIVIKPKDLDARVWNYQLGANPQSAPATEEPADKQLLQQLNAYIQTATSSLLDNTAGAQASPEE